jgi:hypothetical protein
MPDRNKVARVARKLYPEFAIEVKTSNACLSSHSVCSGEQGILLNPFGTCPLVPPGKLGYSVIAPCFMLVIISKQEEQD